MSQPSPNFESPPAKWSVDAADRLPFRGPGTVLEIHDLVVHFPTDFGTVRAVDGVSYSVNRGETLGVVGESGSGKSVTALTILGLIPNPGEVKQGRIMFEGKDLLRVGEDELRSLRGRRIAMIFQDPLTSLNPVFTVGDQIAEVFEVHEGASKREGRQKAVELLETVGIPRASQRARDYPHQFSGGMRQRVMIAMAIALRPSVLIADEPTTALDVTVQAQILELLRSLQQEFEMALILITHDLGVVAEHAETVAVMYAGKIAEYAAVDDIYNRPEHPYTLGLMGSIARLDESRKERLHQIRGAPPSLIRVPPGCPFHPRCDYAQEICTRDYPLLKARTGQLEHLTACHFADGLPPARSIP